MRFTLERGDLLFQDLSSDSITDAIVSVTGGAKKSGFSHVGIVDQNKEGGLVVLEAISKGVCYTDLDSFLMRSTNSKNEPKVEVGRLTSQYSHLIEKALEHGKSFVGKPYDNVYIIGDSSYYCSELIYELFLGTTDSLEVFRLNPMTFKDNKTGEFLPFWVNYYRNLGVEIPEGKPGLNPNGMSESPSINMVYSYHSDNK